MGDTTLKPKSYRPRIVEQRLDALLESFGCVEITGPKWCGKTWTALSRARSQTCLDKSEEKTAAETDPALALLGPTPHLVDEWQEVPEVWDAVRRSIDDSGNKRGLYLLTGSTQLARDERSRVHHSGAGRIAQLRMGPMSLLELGESSGEVSIQSLFDGDFTPTRRDTTLQEIVLWCCRGGWPANIGVSDEVAFELPAKYLEALTNENILSEGKSPETALAVLRALAVNASRAVTRKTICGDLSYPNNVTEDTLASYLQLLNRLYVTEELRGWEPPARAKARVRVSPKRYFADPSLAVALLNAGQDKLFHDMQTLGDLYENLVLRDLRVYMSTYRGLGNDIYYYRDDKGLEVDFILEHDGAWAAVEAKLSATKADDAAANLLKLKRKMLANPQARNAEPAFLAVVVGRGSLFYRRDDGVYVIPLATLAP